MTTQELLSKIDVRKTIGYGSYKVTIEYRGKKYTCISNDSVAYDRHLDDDAKRGYTMKDALKAFYNECKRRNNLR